MTTFKTISEKLATWRRYREAVRELSQLSDRELADIGIRRGDIEFIVRARRAEPPERSAQAPLERRARNKRQRLPPGPLVFLTLSPPG